MALTTAQFAPGALYIAGFAQARAPHVGLIIPFDEASGGLVHIRIDRATSPTWSYQYRVQRITGDMFLTSLLQIRGAVPAAITVEQLCQVASSIPAPSNDVFGECSRWVMKVIQALNDEGLIQVTDIVALEQEFSDFVTGNRAYARRDRFPNVAVSAHCKV
ncbi:hypothetical protein BXZ70DRAFT_1001900 [Cristinia sonorae]|uniref:Uncharacterized protein n=1 Tax=Cristinia sonorae TaxID=1940300 RepID=A0A8K0XLT8_9AGAR|nr:hypothetical protein BXZ70DRAFT_1001900 [Cristinia sonorae]